MDDSKEQMNATSEKEMKSRIREFIVRNFFSASEPDTFEDTDSFMDLGFIDSTGVLELMEFVEDTFGIRFEDEEIVPDNLDSLARLTAFVQRKLNHAGS